MTAPVEPSPTGTRWPALLEALLRGIGHALSNRVAGLLALAEIPPDEHDDESLGLLPHEAQRLQELLRVVKLLPADRAAKPGALMLDDVIGDGCTVMALHPSGREITWSAAGAGGAQPVRVERWMLLRALLLMMDVCREWALAAGSRAATVRVGDGGDGATSLLEVAVVGGDGAAARSLGDGSYLATLVEQLGGTLRVGETLTLALPTLAELRRRER